MWAKLTLQWPQMIEGDSSEIKKVVKLFFLIFPECSLPSTASFEKYNKIGHHAHKRYDEPMLPSLCRSWMQSFLKNSWKENW